jgi:hypothetical protein
MEDRMEKTEDIRPTAELSPEMIKTICDAIDFILTVGSFQITSEGIFEFRYVNNEVDLDETTL